MITKHLKKKYYNNEIIKVNNLYSSFNFEKSTNSTIDNIKNIEINNKRYKNNADKIGKGSYGFIYKFSNLSNDDDYFVVKEYIDKDDYIIDKIISMILYNAYNTYNLKFNIIESYWNDYNRITIMNGMSSDLFNIIYRKKILFYDPIDIFKQVSKSIVDLYNNGIYYCDLKSSNVLLNIIDDRIVCTLGDIGGVFTRKDHKISNLFSSKLLDKEFIILKPYVGFPNYCLVGFYSTSGHKYVGYSKLAPELVAESQKSRKFRISFKYNGKIKLVSELGNNFVIDKLNLNLHTAIFTYPHLNNYEGLIEFNPDFDEKTIDKVLLNNIIQSLGVFLLELLFRSYFKFTHNDIKKYYPKNIESVINIIECYRLSFDKEILLKNIIFGNSQFSGLINENYINVSNFERYIEDINDKLSVFHDWSPMLNN